MPTLCFYTYSSSFLFLIVCFFFSSFFFPCRIKYLTSAASRLLGMFLDLYQSQRFFAESHIDNVFAWLFRDAQNQCEISKHVKMCFLHLILACFATVFHSQCVCECAEPCDLFSSVKLSFY